MIPVREGETPPLPTPTEPPAPTGPPPTWERIDGKVLGDAYADGDSQMRPQADSQTRCRQLGPEKCSGITCGNPFFCQVKHGTTLSDPTQGEQYSEKMVPAPPPTWETIPNKILGDECANNDCNMAPEADQKAKCLQLGPEKCSGIMCGNPIFCQVRHGTSLNEPIHGVETSYKVVYPPSALLSYTHKGGSQNHADGQQVLTGRSS
jgi:hypothetical protein